MAHHHLEECSGGFPIRRNCLSNCQQVGAYEDPEHPGCKREVRVEGMKESWQILDRLNHWGIACHSEGPGWGSRVAQVTIDAAEGKPGCGNGEKDGVLVLLMVDVS